MNKFPLNTPIKTFGGHEANIDFYDSSGYPCGSIKGCGNTWQGRWNEEGSSTDNFREFDLISPKPKREIGYAVWICGDTDEYIGIFSELSAAKTAIDNNTDGDENAHIINAPIPRPGETLCVRPSRDELEKAVQHRAVIYSGNIAPTINWNRVIDGVMELLDGGTK